MQLALICSRFGSPVVDLLVCDKERWFAKRHGLSSWRDFARECFCFGSEAVNTGGEAVRLSVKSRAVSPLANSLGLAGREGIWWLRPSATLAHSRIPQAKNGIKLSLLCSRSEGKRE